MRNTADDDNIKAVLDTYEAIRQFMLMVMATLQHQLRKTGVGTGYDATQHANTLEQLILALNAEANGKPKTPADKYVFWRGSISDLATDLSDLLTAEQLGDLAAEIALTWKMKR